MKRIDSHRFMQTFTKEKRITFTCRFSRSKFRLNFANVKILQKCAVHGRFRVRSVCEKVRLSRSRRVSLNFMRNSIGNR